MVQGKTKGMQAKKTNVRAAKKASQTMKKGRVAIAPKKAPLVKQAMMKQELSAKINRSVEGQMVQAASSGKLTIMKNTIGGAAASKASKKQAGSSK